MTIKHPNLYLAEAMNSIQLAEEALDHSSEKYQWHIEKLVEAHDKLRLVASRLSNHQWQPTDREISNINIRQLQNGKGVNDL